MEFQNDRVGAVAVLQGCECDWGLRVHAIDDSKMLLQLRSQTVALLSYCDVVMIA